MTGLFPAGKTFKRIEGRTIMVEMLKARQLLFDSIQTAFVITDTHSKILYANQLVESFFGYRPKDLEGQRLRALFFEEDLIYFVPNILYLTLYKKGFDGEALMKRKDGKRIFIHLLSASFKEGEERFLTFAIQEIQRMKNLEREKAEMEHWAGLGRIVEGIAHQFRNPVASIGGYANRLAKAISSDGKGRPYVDQILEETGRLETILQRVEEYAELPRPTLRREKIQEMVETALSNFSKLAKEKGVSVQLNTDNLSGDGQLYIDRRQMVKVLGHILENSLEALTKAAVEKSKKNLAVTLTDDGETVEVSVADKGPGIAAKNMSQIFEPFFSTRPDRVGLGLTFARRVMKEHGGKVKVESQLRKGTKVTLYLPKDRRRKVRRELIVPEAGQSEEA
jgi:PAS domain S-box-containing protein